MWTEPPCPRRPLAHNVHRKQQQTPHTKQTMRSRFLRASPPLHLAACREHGKELLPHVHDLLQHGVCKRQALPVFLELEHLSLHVRDFHAQLVGLLL